MGGGLELSSRLLLSLLWSSSRVEEDYLAVAPSLPSLNVCEVCTDSGLSD